jgi:hypothetical protein
MWNKFCGCVSFSGVLTFGYAQIGHLAKQDKLDVIYVACLGIGLMVMGHILKEKE